MDDQPRLPRVSRIILPEEVRITEEHFDELMAQGLVSVLEDEAKDEGQEEETFRKDKIPLDELAGEDFFEDKREKAEQQFGTIAGMSDEAVVSQVELKAETTDDTTAHISKSIDLSNIATEWGRRISINADMVAGEKRDSSSSTDQIKETGRTLPAVDEQSSAFFLTQSDSTTKSLEQSSEDVSTSQSTEGAKDVSAEPSIEVVATQKEPSINVEKTRESRQLSLYNRVSYAQGPIGRKSESRSKSIYYDVPSRITNADQDDFTDFLEIKQDIVLFDDQQEAVEEESEATAPEEEGPVLDRELYYQKYADLGEQLIKTRIKNNILQKLVIMYLRRRKVANILKDTEPPLDQILKYGQKLDAYEELLHINDSQRFTVSNEVNELRTKKCEKSIELETLFRNMQMREDAIGMGLIYAKTGNRIPDKLVERFIKRQAGQMEQVCSMRLKYIKLREMVQEKLDAIARLDVIEGHLHLADYEQLKVENRNYADKMEEKDEELTRLRAKCQSTIQILAHLREKSTALDTDLCDLRDVLDNVDSSSIEIRENLSDLKRARDRFRHMSGKLKEESGLLTKTDLLLDMEWSQKEVVIRQEEFEKVKDEVLKKRKNVSCLRKRIEFYSDGVGRKKAAKIRNLNSKTDSNNLWQKMSGAKSTGTTIYQRRPTMYMPVIKETAFDDLVRVRPTAKISSRRKF